MSENEDDVVAMACRECGPAIICILCRDEHARTNAKAATAKLNDVQQMRNYLGVFEGMQVMLLKNLWQQAGLVNGSMGVLKKVIWGADYTKSPLPEFVIIDFEGYRGPPFTQWPDHWPKDEDRRTWVPIARRAVCSGAIRSDV